MVGVAGKQRHRPRRGRRDDAAVNAGDGPVAKVSTGAYASALVFPRRRCLRRRPSHNIPSTIACVFFLFFSGLIYFYESVKRDVRV